MVSTLETLTNIEYTTVFGQRNVLQLYNEEETLGRIIRQSFYPPDYPDGIDVIGYRGHEKRVDKIISKSPIIIKRQPNGKLIIVVCCECHQRGTPDELPKPDIVFFFTGEIIQAEFEKENSETVCGQHVRQKVKLIKGLSLTINYKP